MRITRLSLLAALLALTALTSSTGAGAATPPANGAAEHPLAQRERQWMKAVQEGDLKTLEEVLAPEFTLTVAIAGEPLWITPRADYVEACKGYYVIHEFAFDEMLVREYGDVATVAARYRQRATLGGTEDRSAEFLLTDVWVRRDGRWQVAARYSSRPEAP